MPGRSIGEMPPTITLLSNNSVLVSFSQQDYATLELKVRLMWDYQSMFAPWKPIESNVLVGYLCEIAVFEWLKKHGKSVWHNSPLDIVGPDLHVWQGNQKTELDVKGQSGKTDKTFTPNDPNKPPATFYCWCSFTEPYPLTKAYGKTTWDKTPYVWPTQRNVRFGACEVVLECWSWGAALGVTNGSKVRRCTPGTQQSMPTLLTSLK